MDAHALVHPRWRVSLADDVRVADRYGGDAIPRLRKMRAIIAVLVCAPGHHIARRELTALLWSDRAPEQARASLRQCLFVLRAKVPSLVEADGEKVWLVDGAMSKWHSPLAAVSISVTGPSQAMCSATPGKPISSAVGGGRGTVRNADGRSVDRDCRRQQVAARAGPVGVAPAASAPSTVRRES